VAAIGFGIVIFPGGTARFVAAQLERYFLSLREHGTTPPLRDDMFDFSALNSQRVVHCRCCHHHHADARALLCHAWR